VKAYWTKRSLGSLDECRGSWCKVKVGGVAGWAARSRTWGVQEAPVCGPPRS
jgi:SH3-like domain-containing protein